MKPTPNPAKRTSHADAVRRALDALTVLLDDLDISSRDLLVAQSAYAMGVRTFLALLAEHRLPRIRIEAVTTVLALDTPDARLRAFVGVGPDADASGLDMSDVRAAAVRKALDPDAPIASMYALLDATSTAEPNGRPLQTCVEPS